MWDLRIGIEGKVREREREIGGVWNLQRERVIYSRIE
jgi:hypothetical protein